MCIESKKNLNRKKLERKYFVKKKKQRAKKGHKKEKSISNIIIRNLLVLKRSEKCSRNVLRNGFSIKE
ncbi:hypothetical protein EO92_18515 [Methanosarcina sp. 2.H.A.1B.4]|nr:hypothetical protein EO92_18515 [Methanosarcina sp. 2.H.A.1B.4]